MDITAKDIETTANVLSALIRSCDKEIAKAKTGTAISLWIGEQNIYQLVLNRIRSVDDLFKGKIKIK